MTTQQTIVSIISILNAENVSAQLLQELLNNKKVAIDYVEVINGFVYIFGSFTK